MRGGAWCGRLGWRLAILPLAAALGAGEVQAKDSAKDAPKQPSIWEQDTLTGDWGGARSALKNKGIEFTLVYINETLAVLSGGLNRRASYEGRLEASVDTDMQKLTGWSGASTHVTFYEIHNIGHTTALDNVGSIADPSNIDALATGRLFTAWFQQNAFDDRVSLRIGQLAADDEFLISPTAGGLINGTFGWAALVASDTLNGGPAYPVAVPGVRLAVKATDNLTVLSAVFAGDPAGANCADFVQKCNFHGLKAFDLNGGVFSISELQYAVNQDKQAMGLPGIYKFGGWYASVDFADQRFDLDPAGSIVSAADPAAADSLNHRGNWGIYGVADQMVWRAGKQSLNLFARGGFSPSDRNLLSFYIDGGAGLKGPLPGRDDDVLTFGVAYSGISRDASALDQDMLALNGPPQAIRDYELLFELNYTVQIAPWWTLQPDLQYIVHPNGGQNPIDPTRTLGDAFVAGVRSTIKF
jgi:porin